MCGDGEGVERGAQEVEESHGEMEEEEEAMLWAVAVMFADMQRRKETRRGSRGGSPLRQEVGDGEDGSGILPLLTATGGRWRRGL